MKQTLLILFLSTGFFAGQCQRLELSSVIKEAYSKTSDRSVVQNRQLSYILPKFIEFIDTTQMQSSDKVFRIFYFDDEASFQTHLKQVHTTLVLNVYFNQILPDKIILTLEILNTDEAQYFGSFKFLTFVDKRQIRLKYSTSQSRWVYDCMLKLYDEPVVGKD